MTSCRSTGLKTVEDALEIRRRMLIAFKVAERESDAPTRAEWLILVESDFITGECIRVDGGRHLY
jgi:hypothetical protein